MHARVHTQTRGLLTAQEWRNAVSRCDEALALVGSAACGAELEVKALLRRARSLLGCHEPQAALRDLARAAQLDPWHEGIPSLRAAAHAAQRGEGDIAARELAARMLRLPVRPNLGQQQQQQG